MYKLLLCWRYLRTRFIAFASIISVMLGVATMIVVNSVMSGFTTEMQNRIHGILSDLSFESRDFNGFQDADWHKDQILRLVGDQIEGMTATVVVPAMLNFQHRGRWVTRQVQLIGIDERTQASVSDFGKYLQHPANRRQLLWELRQDGYDERDHQSGEVAPLRKQMKEAGWGHRKWMAENLAFERQVLKAEERDEALRKQQAIARPLHKEDSLGPAGNQGSRLEGPGRLPRMIEPQSYEVDAEEESPRVPWPAERPARPADAAVAEAPGAAPEMPGPSAVPSPEDVPAVDPFAARGGTQPDPVDEFNPAKEQHTGIVLGIALVSFRTPEGEDRFLALPGDDVKLTFPTVGAPPKAMSDDFTVVDLYESKMSEYDASFVFVPIRKLQELRGMIDPTSQKGLVNSIQIKLKPGANGEEVRDRLREAFAPELYGIYTWRDKQGPLLAAVQMETAILNVLLFLIIAVAGFGILAIFYMIVVEKTRDIGILKSLGASGRGVMGIFLSYGLSLGLVGSGVGMVLGLLFVRYINQIADLLGLITGHRVFDPSIYYFYTIPTIVDPRTIAWIMIGAVGIAVAASVLPARRAARLHPVEALRYE